MVVACAACASALAANERTADVLDERADVATSAVLDAADTEWDG